MKSNKKQKSRTWKGWVLIRDDTGQALEEDGAPWLYATQTDALNAGWGPEVHAESAELRIGEQASKE